MLKGPTLLRYLFYLVWFFVVPFGLAYVAVQLLEGPSDAVSTGFLGLVRGFARDQPIPAGIILFTVFEMTLWSFRHRLPGASYLSVAGRHGLPLEIRRDYEAAGHLVEEAERILDKRAKAVEREIPAKTRTQIQSSLDRLKKTMEVEPFDEDAFSEAFENANAATRRLNPWRKGELREYVESIGIAVLIALLLRAIVVEAFKIPSGSMLPTLQINDHIFVNKFTYGPTIPFTRARLLADMPPERGDVIVFEFPDPDPNSQRQDFIKRVIGLPGDELEVKDGHPVINGWPVPNCKVGRYQFGKRGPFGPQTGELYVEFLGDYAYLTLFEDGIHHQGRQGPYRVKEGEVWVFGDNRHNSSDSRAWFGGRGGGVPFRNIKGRAMFVWFPPSRLLVNVMGLPQLPEGAPSEAIKGIEACLARRPPTSQTTPPRAP